MTTTARTAAEAATWVINEEGLSTQEAIGYCWTVCEGTDTDEGVTVFYFADESSVRFDEEKETFSHDLEF